MIEKNSECLKNQFVYKYNFLNICMIKTGLISSLISIYILKV